MKMTEKQRPSAKDILDGILRAMHGSQEPLEEDLILVPSVYELQLHPEVYQELQALLPRIREQAMVRLDEELARLNRPRGGGLAMLLGRLARPILRLLFAEVYVERLSRRPAAYERVGAAWHIDIGVTAEPDVGRDHLVVETDFGSRGQALFQGRPTVTIRRRTLRLPDGRFETVLSVPRGGPAYPGPGSGRPGPSQVLARLSFRDNQGQHVYYMKKEQIVIGRQDGPGHVPDVALDTLKDVSREHARIRHDAGSGEFTIKNISRFGATVNGVRVVPSLNEQEEDLDLWIPLPRKAEIGLADAVFIQFEAL